VTHRPLLLHWGQRKLCNKGIVSCWNQTRTQTLSKVAFTLNTISHGVDNYHSLARGHGRGLALLRTPEAAAEGAASRPFVEPTFVEAWEYGTEVYIQKNRSTVEVICTPGYCRLLGWLLKKSPQDGIGM
jgi:hypothetical protein